MSKTSIPKEARAYLASIGSIKTEKKAAASRANAEKARAARRRNPLDLICICDGGESLKAGDHKTTCPRGRLLHQRARAEAAKAAAPAQPEGTQ